MCIVLIGASSAASLLRPDQRGLPSGRGEVGARELRATELARDLRPARIARAEITVDWRVPATRADRSPWTAHEERAGDRSDRVVAAIATPPGTGKITNTRAWPDVTTFRERPTAHVSLALTHCTAPLVVFGQSDQARLYCRAAQRAGLRTIPARSGAVHACEIDR